MVLKQEDGKGSTRFPRLGAYAVVLIAGLAIWTGSMVAADSDLDPFFGNGGISTFAPSGDPGAYEAVDAVAVLPDGRLILAITQITNYVGSPSGGDRIFSTRLARMNPDGSLDPTFGIGGSVHHERADFGRGALAVQADGKIVVGGCCDAQLARFNADGSVDTAFDGDGYVSLGIEVRDVALQSDGRIVVAGENGADMVVVRLNTNGSIDSASFNPGVGRVAADFGGLNDRAFGVAIQPDGKIVIGGDRRLPPEGFDLDGALARFNHDGSIDTSFGSSGKVTLGLVEAQIFDVVLQHDGKIVAIGRRTTAEGVTPMAVRLHTNGSLDTGFGNGGFAEGSLVGTLLQGVVDSEGRIIGAGFSKVVRWRPDGTLDPSFGHDGVAQFDALDARHVALQHDGKILVVGAEAVDGPDVPDAIVLRFVGKDSDGDGLADVDEIDRGTNPFAPDTDGDGLTDAEEIRLGTDPLRPDTDGDGVDDGDEIELGMDPLNRDEDGDQIPDGSDPDTVARVVTGLPVEVFSAPGHRVAVLSILDDAESMIAGGDVEQAMSLLRNLRRRMDGCGSLPDVNDWIADCAAQLAVREAIDRLLTSLGA